MPSLVVIGPPQAYMVPKDHSLNRVKTDFTDTKRTTTLNERNENYTRMKTSNGKFHLVLRSNVPTNFIIDLYIIW